MTLDQFQALRDLCAELENNPFYRNKIKDWEAYNDLASLLQFLPFTSKQALVEDQEKYPPFGQNRSDGHSFTRFHQTSGSSGKEPMVWLDTQENWAAIKTGWCCILDQAGVNAHDRALFAFSFGPFLGFWSAFDAAVDHGLLCVPTGGWDSTSRLSAIERFEITVLFGTPTYLMRLGERRPETCRSVRHLIVAGEPGGSLPAVRNKLEKLWPGAHVFDHHGMTELGPVTFQDPENDQALKVMEHQFLVEILDGDEPVDVGQSGELVLTTLARKHAPLIRYRTGDLVQRGESKAIPGISSELCLSGGILGRLDDMRIIRGVNILPSALEDVVRQFDDVIEFQVREFNKREMLEIEVLVETQKPEMIQRIETALRSRFSMRIPVKIVEANTLPRFELKSKRWVQV